MQITPVNRGTVVDEVYEQMIQNITKGSWRPGEKIPSENELKDMFKVSRNTVRGVIHRLNVLGVLKTVHGEGTYVMELGPSIYTNYLMPAILLDKHSFMEVMEFRMGIEVEAAKLAAERAEEDDIKVLKEILRKLKESKDNISVYAKEDLNFHLAIAKASKNKMFLNIMEIIKCLMQPHVEEVIKELGNSDSLEYHPVVFEAIKNHDSDKAGRYMSEQLTLGIQRFRASKK